ncbi:MAG: pyridoxamine 5'-phosphate oxidase family protein [Chloroflexota bacterium]|nr:pyridoxamine 5'-phosphate oxidase family protein [Chloroflexota bacterium]
MDNNDQLLGQIKRLFASQRFAVLATQFEGQPYSNLVAFAESDDLKSLLFVTGRGTRKYSNTLASKKVAVLIDNRTNQVVDLASAIAVTALGTIEEIDTDAEHSLSGVYLSKHPQLKDFLYNPSNALLKITVTDYVVATFGSVGRLSVGEMQ